MSQQKVKSLFLGSGVEDTIFWQLKQKINDKGKIHGTGYFYLKSREEAQKYLNAYNRKNYKRLNLASGVEEGCYWSAIQDISKDGKLIGIGSVLINDKRERRRHTTLGTHGKIYTGLDKRKRPEKCEICKEPTNRLAYHHWDDSNLNKGIWCCTQCHWLIEYYEKLSFNDICKLLAIYIDIKIKVNQEFD